MGGNLTLNGLETAKRFQYPLMDRLYFGGGTVHTPPTSSASVSVSSDGSFVFWGAPPVLACSRASDVSVSSDGSFVFWGGFNPSSLEETMTLFQYPLMDRLYFGGST